MGFSEVRNLAIYSKIIKKIMKFLDYENPLFNEYAL